MVDRTFFCPLTHEGILAIRGVDASKFLQGQVTCNLNYLSASYSSLGARCTPKGRMQSSFRVVALDDGYLLAMDAVLVDSQLADLKKYAVFSKSTLSDATADYARFGLSQADEALTALDLPLPQAAGSVVVVDVIRAVRLSDGRCELWVAAEQGAALQAKLASLLPQRPLNDWLLTQVRAGVGQVFAPTRELFIPQMLNLQALDGVSFKKGCYTGQEIVARMQYLGKLKRRLYRLSLADTSGPLPGTPLFSPVHGSAVGEVVLAAQTDEGVELLAVLQEDAVSDGRLHLGALEGPHLNLLDLPYTLDSNREILR
jgi:folate-binding protein YgfZ